MKDSMKELYDLIENMPITEKNKNVIDEIKIAIKEENNVPAPGVVKLVR